MVNDEELVQQVRRGETGAFDELYRRYSRRLYSYIRRHLQQREAAEDLLQEVFLTVLSDRARFGEGRFAGWLFTVARNRCLTRLRDHHRDLHKQALYLEQAQSTVPAHGTPTCCEGAEP